MENIDNNCECTVQFYIILTFKYHNDRFNCLCNFTAQKKKIM